MLYGVMNEGTINVLGSTFIQRYLLGIMLTGNAEHYFEMSRYDAERALGIYKTFTKQTNMVVEFLSTARQYENATRLEIPKLKHAPTSLTSSLEEYLHDPDFEVNRRQYLAQQDAKKGKKGTSNGAPGSMNNFSKALTNKGSSSKDFPEPKPVQTAQSKTEPKGPGPDLIDFFDSIEQNQQPMAANPSQQQQISNFGVGPQYQQQMQLQHTGVLPQQQPNFFPQASQPNQQPNGANYAGSNPFGQPQAQQQRQNFSNTGFGGFSQQPTTLQQDFFSSAPQNSGPQTQQLQPQQTFNTGPQMMATGQQSFGTPQRSMTTGASNPFRQSNMATGASTSSYSSNQPINSPASPQSTNPFARNITGQMTGKLQNSPYSSQPTASPFTSIPPQPQPPQNPPFTSPLPQTDFQQNTPFMSPPPQPQPQQQQQGPAPITPHKTGKNPIARSNT